MSGGRFVNTKILVRTILAATMLLGAAESAQALVIGTGINDNCIPFQCRSGTRYQQVYAASNFGGVTSITSFSFFDRDGGSTITAATYTVRLSTSNFTVDNLDTATLSNNPGSDAALFTSVALGGPILGRLDFIAGVGGGSAFLYDPVAGDLLIDIVLTGVGTRGSGSFDAHARDAGGLFSRAHDFGTGFEGFGLNTGFNLDSPKESGIPEPATLSLMGIGFLGAGLARRRRKFA